MVMVMMVNVNVMMMVMVTTVMGGMEMFKQATQHGCSTSGKRV